MKDLFIFTNEIVTMENCIEILSQHYKNFKVEDEKTIHYGNPPKSFYIFLENTRIKESNDPFVEELRHIPLDNPYCTSIEFHWNTCAQTLASLFEAIRPEAFVYDPQENWYGTAKEYKDKTDFKHIIKI